VSRGQAPAAAADHGPLTGMPWLRVATYNIHKGVSGLGPRQRLEILNLVHAVEQFDADVVCLQEVRAFNHRQARRFAHWPSEPQAEFLAPEGYQAVYRTNAVTRDGEHGNALLSRWPVVAHGHRDVSDHRFEQRGILHAQLLVQGVAVHVLVVHLGLIHASRLRQVALLLDSIARDVPAGAPLVVAGDFNDWGGKLHGPMAEAGLRTFEQLRLATFPSRAPLLSLDRIYVRGLRPLASLVPRGRAWARMSDHLPLVGDFELD